jgi:CRISPR system Cascade subunit CasB
MSETHEVSSGAPERLVSGLAFQIISGSLTRRDVASLRRMNPREPEPAFYKLESLVLDDHLPGDETQRIDAETRWAAIVAGLAHLEGLHRKDERLGRVLADAGYSEIRFIRLIRADPERLVDELPQLAKFLAAKGVPVDWTGAAHLMLSAGRHSEDTVRRHIARDYYGILARGEQFAASQTGVSA